jgi:nucleoside-diphosphate-sugar epimerase
LSQLHREHPDFEYSALIRTQDKADKVKAAYPHIRVVLGGLDDATLLEDEAARADVVIHAADASDHEGAAQAIAAGLDRGHSAAKPGYWLHTGGAGILTYLDDDAGRLGEHSDKEFNDLAGVHELTHLPDHAFHRAVDKIVLGAAAAGKARGNVRVALIAPPTIYGQGRGPVARRGRQVYELSKLILQKQYAPVVGAGKARWNHIHIADLSALYVLLVEAAATGEKTDAWGPDAYYLAECGEHTWGDLSKSLATQAAERGLIAQDWKSSPLSRQDALDAAGFEAVSWGLNSRGRAVRAAEVLGWRPTRAGIEGCVDEIVLDEAERWRD